MEVSAINKRIAESELKTKPPTKRTSLTFKPTLEIFSEMNDKLINKQNNSLPKDDKEEQINKPTPEIEKPRSPINKPSKPIEHEDSRK